MTGIVVRYRSVGDLTDDSVASPVLAMLERCDTEFVPPLSTRRGALEQDLSGSSDHDVTAYFEDLCRQQTIVAETDDGLAGFVSFRRHYDDDRLGGRSPSVYVSTIVVDDAWRGHSVGKGLVAALIECATDFEERWLTTRTWHSNVASRKLFGGAGFAEVCRLEDDRGPAEHTLYLARPNDSTNSLSSVQSQ